MPTPPCRRWFQISLAEWLILTLLLGIVWWQCARWPVTETVLVGVAIDLPGPVPSVKSTELQDMERKPMWDEAVVRGAIWSAALIAGWLVVSNAKRWLLQSHSHMLH